MTDTARERTQPNSSPAIKAWATRRERARQAASSAAAMKAWETRRRLAVKRLAYIDALRKSMARAIALARRRQAERAAQGKPAAAVTVTVEELMAKLAENGYRCAVTGLPFYVDDAVGSFGPSRPSLDRIEVGGDYSARNVRVVYLGVNSLRGCGSDADMRRIARAIVDRE
jgi:hypothetical protein